MKERNKNFSWKISKSGAGGNTKLKFFARPVVENIALPKFAGYCDFSQNFVPLDFLLLTTSINFCDLCEIKSTSSSMGEKLKEIRVGKNNKK